jgi:hydrogenase maturation protease
MSASSERLAVVGLGNPLRRDDGIGIRLLAMLRPGQEGKRIVFYDFGTASLGLVNLIKDFRKVLLIDAIDAGLPPAELKIFKFHEASFLVREKKASSHELSLSDLLRVCNALGVAADVRIAGIQVKDISYGLEMTDELENAKQCIAGQILEFIDNWK